MSNLGPVEQCCLTLAACTGARNLEAGQGASLAMSISGGGQAMAALTATCLAANAVFQIWAVSSLAAQIWPKG